MSDGEDRSEQNAKNELGAAALRDRIEQAERTNAECLLKVNDLNNQVDAARAKVAELLSSTGASAAAIAASMSATHDIHSRASALLAVLEQLQQRALAALKESEEARRKADSESGFAFNAKTNAEEHAKKIAQISGTVEATFAGLTASKVGIDEIATTVSAAKVNAEAQLKVITDLKGNGDRLSAEMVSAKARVDAVIPVIDQGAKDANAIIASKSASDANAAAIQLLQTQLSEVVVKAEAEGRAIAEADAETKRLSASMLDARNTANEANARIRAYEDSILGLQDAFSAMHAKLEGLLPHATSVGLASAFHVQKARFAKTQPRWLSAFVAALVGLLVMALVGLPPVNESWDAVLRHFVNRLPFVVPLVWLAIYAGHQYNMALRMEEDYAFKEAVSTAFEGYKREMQGIPATSGSDVSPLVRLCENVLTSLAERPGRIYEGKTDVVTPMTPVLTTIKDVITEALKRKDGPERPAA